MAAFLFKQKRSCHPQKGQQAGRGARQQLGNWGNGRGGRVAEVYMTWWWVWEYEQLSCDTI